MPPRRMKSLLKDLLSKIDGEQNCKKTIQKMCEEMDLNSDGKIDKEEFFEVFHHYKK